MNWQIQKKKESNFNVRIKYKIVNFIQTFSSIFNPKQILHHFDFDSNQNELSPNENINWENGWKEIKQKKYKLSLVSNGAWVKDYHSQP